MSDFLPDIIVDEPIEMDLTDEQLDEQIKSLEHENKKYEEEDIFKGKEPPKMKMVIEETEEPEEPEPEPLPTPKPKPVKKKRVMSDEHKQKLALARDKALITRRNNALLKKEKKDLEKQLKENELNDLREKVRPKKKVVIHEPEPEHKNTDTEKKYPPNNVYSYSQKDIEDISTNAIMNYEKIRKQRKAKKQEQKAIDREEDIVRQKVLELTTATPQYYSVNGEFDNCY